jgi:cation diffusion facilitator family transporter
MERRSLTRYALLSIFAALATIVLKAVAYLLTGSVGLLSDALESLVNLAGAVMAMTMLTIAARPPDKDHHYGHDKAEYFSSGVEGTLILIAAISIGIAAVQRFMNPKPLEQVGLGIAVSVVASLINFAVARVLIKVGKAQNSITLEANAHHLMTDVWTSVGVLAGVGVVSLTGWNRFDPIIATAVALNILWTGFRLIKESVQGLMDTALSPEEQATIRNILEGFTGEGIAFRNMQTRKAASREFVSVDILVPPVWTVEQGHQALSRIEEKIRETLQNATVLTHLEPMESDEQKKQ